MEFQLVYSIATVLGMLLTATHTSGLESIYKKLHRDLFMDYSPVIPIMNLNKPLDVRLSMTPINIAVLDEMHNEVHMEAWISMYWNTSLTWSPEQYNGITSVKVPSRELWVPDITIYNSVGKLENESPDLVSISSDGRGMWTPKWSIRGLCDIEGQNRSPNVTCSLKFGSWLYDGFHISLDDPGDAMDFSNYFEGSRYWIVNSSPKRNVIYYSCCPEPFYDMDFTFTFVDRFKNSKIKGKGIFDSFQSFLWS